MAKEITKIELKECLRHYWRMRRWAKDQSLNDKVSCSEMFFDLRESWKSDSCILCTNYRKCASYLIVKCSGCPLSISKHNCELPNSVWKKMNNSRNWKEFILNCTEMAKIIMKLPREKEE